MFWVRLLLMMVFMGYSAGTDVYADPESAKLPEGVEDRVWQSGIFGGLEQDMSGAFVKCSYDDPDLLALYPNREDCRCDAEIHYPFFLQANQKVNDLIFSVVSVYKCEGDLIDDIERKNLVGKGRITMSSYVASYSIKYINSKIANVLFEFYPWNGGHTNWQRVPLTINLETGQQYHLEDIFDPKDLSAINEYVYSELQEALKSGEAVSENTIEELRDKYIQIPCSDRFVDDDFKEGKQDPLPFCRKWSFDKDGITIYFQKYEFSCCYTPEIRIPTKYLRNKDLLNELEQQHAQ